MHRTEQPSAVPLFIVCDHSLPLPFSGWDPGCHSPRLCAVFYSSWQVNDERAEQICSPFIRSGFQIYQSKNDNSWIYYLVNYITCNMQPFKCSFSFLQTFKEETGQTVSLVSFLSLSGRSEHLLARHIPIKSDSASRKLQIQNSLIDSQEGNCTWWSETNIFDLASCWMFVMRWAVNLASHRSLKYLFKGSPLENKGLSRFSRLTLDLYNLRLV